MKRRHNNILNLLIGVFMAGIILAGIGCGHKDDAATSKALEKSFEKANPEVKQTVATTVQAIQSASLTQDVSAQKAHYIEALKPMKELVAQGNLSQEQTKAVVKQFNEVNKAIQKNPRLATSKELYNAQNEMAQALLKAGVRP